MRPARTAAFLCAAALVLAACGSFASSRSTPKPSGSITAVLVAAAFQLDPARASDDGSLAAISAACDSLTSLDPVTRTAQPALAASWKLSFGSRRLVIHLRRGARFTNRRAVSASAVIESLSRTARPETASPWADLLSDVTGFQDVASGSASDLAGLRRVDPTTLEISFSRPRGDFPEVLSHPGLAPASITGQPPSVDCSGPFRMQGGAPGQDLTLERVASHPGGSGGKPPVRSITIRPAGSAEEGFDALGKREADMAEVPDGAPDKPPGYSLASGASPEVAYLLMDSRQGSDPGLREAVSLAIDRLALIDAVYGPRRAPLARWQLYAAGPAPACSAFAHAVSNPEAARKALGNPPGGSRLSLAFDSGEFPPALAQGLAGQIHSVLGLGIDAAPMGRPDFAASLSAGTAGTMWLATGGADLPLSGRVLAKVLGPGTQARALGAGGQDFDEYLARAEASGPGEAAQRQLQAAENSICRDMQVIPLWRTVRQWAYRPDRVGFPSGGVVDAWGRPMLRNAYHA